MVPALFSALALALSQPHTVWTGPRIEAFTMDGPRIAWIAGSCRTVRVRKTAGGKAAVLGTARTTECDNRGTPAIALAGKRALWTEVTFGNFTYTNVWTRAVGEKRPKRVDYVVHENDLDGDWLTSMSGQGTTLAYADLVVSGKTLADDTDVYFADSGRIRRIVHGRKRTLPNYGGPPYAIAVSNDQIEIVSADPSEHQSAILRPLSSVVIRNLAGEYIAGFFVEGRLRAVALTRSYGVALAGGHVQVYSMRDRSTETLPGGGFGPALAASGDSIVATKGRQIWLFKGTFGPPRHIATAAATPIGLSIAGHTVAWAENVRGQGRIRTVHV